MFTSIRNWIRDNEKYALAGLVIVFILIRLPGTMQPLHQDEYKWPLIVNPVSGQAMAQIPHPPLSQFIYRTAGEVVGFDVHFRFVPLVFSVINLLLLYIFLRGRFGRRTAFIGGTLFTFSYFSVLASLMVDTDGAVMPFFFLLMCVAYDKARSIYSKTSTATFSRRGITWTSVALLAAVAGLFVKVSFVLGVAALATDFIWEQRSRLRKADILKYGGYALSFIVGFAVLLVISQKIFPFFSLGSSLTYWEHFASSNRNWFQTAIQVVKATLYASPFLILAPLWTPREARKKLIPFFAFLVYGFIFYIVLFDFSVGALDRYMQFIIIPLCAIGAVAVAAVSRRIDVQRQRVIDALLIGTGIAVVCTLFAFLPHFAPSLYPKAAWIGRVTSLKWTFLYPFSGGSGPMGFYISFLFMGGMWLASLGLVFMSIFKKSIRPYVLITLIPLGLAYNLMFTEEYLFGRINGYAPRILAHVVTFIKNNPDIQYVTVYNDNGGQEIQGIGKYRKRLYTSPEFDLDVKIQTLNTYKEHYLEINIPQIDPTSVYRKYLDSCKVVYNETDQAISAKVYDCRGVGDVGK